MAATQEQRLKLSDLKLLGYTHIMLSTSRLLRLVVLIMSCWALCTYTLLFHPFQDMFHSQAVVMGKHSFSAPIPHKAWQREVSIAEDETFSACLLVNDDNHFLIEWLAYHYHTLPLRYLVVAVDPRSQTSPSPIFDRWRNREEDGMTILEWDDEDFMSQDELQKAEEVVQMHFGDITSSLVRHRARQRLFYYKCMKHMKEGDRSWTLLTDTDEFLRINYKTLEAHGFNKFSRIPSIAEPSSIRTVLQAELNRPQSNLTNSPCIQIPRLRFGAVPSVDAPTNTLPGAWDTDKFLTLFWRKHAGVDQYWANKISKVLIDVSQVTWNELVPVESIHRPIKSLCNKRKLHVRSSESILVINHYLGSYEQYDYRNDARVDEKREGRNRAVYNKQKQLGADTDDEIQPWLKGFVEKEGNAEAKMLLDGVGVLRPKGQFHNAFMPKFKEDERCAILFFGLPRSFKDMVLPSLKKNLLTPNARYNCDYFVHYYYRTEEPEGRANNGGKLNPTEILDLEKAVKDTAAATTTKANDHAAIVLFHADTEEDFWNTRNNTIQKYRNSKDRDGNYLYFPWQAKSYHYPSSLDNIVRQWHSISGAWELMEESAKRRGIKYQRVGMFRSDVLYVTPTDIYQTDRESYDRTNSQAMLAPFGAMPVNDRMFYGPHDAVEIWATKRFELLESYVYKCEPGWAMHSEKYLDGAIMPAVRELGISVVVNPDICFLRTRADFSAVTTDCRLMGTTRDFENKNMKAVVESIVNRKCSAPYRVTASHISVQCEPHITKPTSRRKRR